MRYVISPTQPRRLLIKLCRENLFRISNLIKSNRQNKLKLGIGFKAKARASAYFTKLGWRFGCIFVSGVCVRGWVYVYMVEVCKKGGNVLGRREKRNYTIISYLLH